jgi:hypothetical protein
MIHFLSTQPLKTKRFLNAIRYFYYSDPILTFQLMIISEQMNDFKSFILYFFVLLA